MIPTLFAVVMLTVSADPPAPPNPIVVSTVLSPDAQWAALQATVRIGSGANSGPVATAVCVRVKNGYAYLLTSNHTVPKGEVKTFEFFTKESYPKSDSTINSGDIILRLPECDVALVKVVVGPLGVPSIPLAGPNQRPKKFPFAAVAIGCPEGDPVRARAERITAKKLVRKADETIAFFWEADKAPVGGMSGGPLIDENGRVIGLCTAAQSGQGYYTHLDEILAGLKRNGYGWLAANPAMPEP